ncbi:MULTISPECIES: hypothetical protein [Streptomyces]|uniref:hypothetical protein n=1 Tax=Streptomyces TaxID=1883 RepID=UPI0004BEF213|nr:MULTISPECIES: hypothetical protein [Streptomyces]KOG82268.1 hypothetical protein ADK33_09600 [Streptomyces griseus subsp. rhodochrous]MBD3543886.1 hypothetical protein [Streptomyces sp. JV180]MDP9947273.1 hypothetical protein [Streptomyces sp. DSM 41269]
MTHNGGVPFQHAAPTEDDATVRGYLAATTGPVAAVPRTDTRLPVTWARSEPMPTAAWSAFHRLRESWSRAARSSSTEAASRTVGPGWSSRTKPASP